MEQNKSSRPPIWAIVLCLIAVPIVFIIGGMAYTAISTLNDVQDSIKAAEERVELAFDAFDGLLRDDCPDERPSVGEATTQFAISDYESFTDFTDAVEEEFQELQAKWRRGNLRFQAAYDEYQAAVSNYETYPDADPNAYVAGRSLLTEQCG